MIWADCWCASAEPKSGRAMDRGERETPAGCRRGALLQSPATAVAVAASDPTPIPTFALLIASCCTCCTCCSSSSFSASWIRSQILSNYFCFVDTLRALLKCCHCAHWCSQLAAHRIINSCCVHVSFDIPTDRPAAWRNRSTCTARVHRCCCCSNSPRGS